MSKPSIDELLQKADSRYMLVSIISKRAREIVDGAEILVKTTDTKAVNIAVEEFYQDKITYKE
ncbi:MAG: DNA-directed RNA polymerase subunit omega [Dethiosulfatibacter sp.]|nr:DNA-directed RNA polymerase subunit omega [Dethiosulfatibacter sp.]